MDINLNSRMFLNNMRMAQKMESVATQRIASGKRVNSASDDPTAIGKIQRLTAQINASKYVQANLKDAKGVTDSMEQALNSVNSNANDLIELAVKHNSDTTSASEKTDIEASATQVLKDMAKTMADADYNGKKVFSSATYTFQSGTAYADQYTVNTPKFNLKDNGDGTFDITKADGTTLAGKSATDILQSDFITDNIVKETSTGLSSIGATQNLLDKKIDYLSSMDVVNNKALDDLQGVDIAQETANIAKAQSLLTINSTLQANTMANQQQFIGTLLNAIR